MEVKIHEVVYAEIRDRGRILRVDEDGHVEIRRQRYLGWEWEYYDRTNDDHADIRWAGAAAIANHYEKKRENA
jgi:hypothetical protein